MKFSKKVSSRGLRQTLASAFATALLFAAVSTTASAATLETATDWFVGAALIPSGQTSPVAVNPANVTVRSDGAIGLGYTYRAAGRASGQLPGPFTYEEHGYLYFRNPADPATFVGSRFVSGAFTVTSPRSGQPVTIADTAPELYTSGVQTLASKLGPEFSKATTGRAGLTAPLAYGYFTFTNNEGTFTGYATPDFTRFAIEIKFGVPA